LQGQAGAWWFATPTWQINCWMSQAVGVNTAIISGTQGLAFAVPSNTLSFATWQYWQYLIG